MGSLPFMATSQRTQSKDSESTDADQAPDQGDGQAPRPVWNPATMGPVPAGSEDQYQLAPPPAEVPQLGPTGKPPETDKE